jgi:hypothetical protein
LDQPLFHELTEVNLRRPAFFVCSGCVAVTSCYTFAFPLVSSNTAQLNDVFSLLGQELEARAETNRQLEEKILQVECQLMDFKASRNSESEELVKQLRREKDELETKFIQADKQRLEQTEVLRSEWETRLKVERKAVEDLEIKAHTRDNDELNLKSLNQSLMQGLKELRAKLEEQTGQLSRDLQAKDKGLLSVILYTLVKLLY